MVANSCYSALSTITTQTTSPPWANGIGKTNGYDISYDISTNAYKWTEISNIKKAQLEIAGLGKRLLGFFYLFDFCKNDESI